jgi:hypothetical protein
MEVNKLLPDRNHASCCFRDCGPHVCFLPWMHDSVMVSDQGGKRIEVESSRAELFRRGWAANPARVCAEHRDF